MDMLIALVGIIAAALFLGSSVLYGIVPSGSPRMKYVKRLSWISGIIAVLALIWLFILAKRVLLG